MFRRRQRRPREIAFSLDSFLDLIANVVGIIIRLILVAWVGARSYHLLTNVSRPDEPPAPLAEERDEPLRHELAKSQEELAQAQKRLGEQLRLLQKVQAGGEQAKESLTA